MLRFPMKKRSRPINSRHGFTLIELMIVCGITMIALVGLLATYVQCLDLAETTRNSQRAMSAAQSILEEVRTIAFTSVASTYNNYNFTVGSMAVHESAGRVTVDSSDPSLLEVTIGVCWRQGAGRLIGACQYSGGVVTPTNASGVLESPVQIVSLVAQR
jgi:type II secretory pathway pseudopilin PulG